MKNEEKIKILQRAIEARNKAIKEYNSRIKGWTEEITEMQEEINNLQAETVSNNLREHIIEIKNYCKATRCIKCPYDRKDGCAFCISIPQNW